MYKKDIASFHKEYETFTMDADIVLSVDDDDYYNYFSVEFVYYHPLTNQPCQEFDQCFYNWSVEDAEQLDKDIAQAREDLEDFYLEHEWYFKQNSLDTILEAIDLEEKVQLLLQYVPDSYCENDEIITFIELEASKIDEVVIQLLKEIYTVFNIDYKLLLDNYKKIDSIIPSIDKIKFLKEVAKDNIKTLDDLLIYAEKTVCFQDDRELLDYVLDTFPNLKIPNAGHYVLFKQKK